MFTLSIPPHSSLQENLRAQEAQTRRFMAMASNTCTAARTVTLALKVIQGSLFHIVPHMYHTCSHISQKIDLASARRSHCHAGYVNACPPALYEHAELSCFVPSFRSLHTYMMCEHRAGVPPVYEHAGRLHDVVPHAGGGADGMKGQLNKPNSY